MFDPKRVWNWLTNYVNNSLDNEIIWTDGESIFTKDEYYANDISNAIDLLVGRNVSVTGYYDPKENEINRCTDEYTGWYYVSIE